MGLAVWIMGLPFTAGACATCFGASDSPMAQGMNLGILSLLGVIGGVLFGVASFFVFLACRANRLANRNPDEGGPMFPESARIKQR
jgi:hypothetical protein